MNIKERISVPTGDIIIVEGKHGGLEFLSIGDYGKDVNIKADFLGLGYEPMKVRHTDIMPLEKKWVITISTQYGCSMGCTFCDVPKVGPGRNATFGDLINQVKLGMSLHPEVTYSERLNLHYARMGEPTFNESVIWSAVHLHGLLNDRYNLHPVVSTMMPCRNRHLDKFIHDWMHVKNVVFEGNAGLQLSINSTNEDERLRMFSGNACRLGDIAYIMGGLYPVGRKVTLNFAVCDYEIDPSVLLTYFSPEYYIVKLTPMHKTRACVDNDVKTMGDYTEYYPYKEHEEKLRVAGYDTLVFIASKEEDEGRITCGNAILSGSRPFDI